MAIVEHFFLFCLMMDVSLVEYNHVWCYMQWKLSCFPQHGYTESRYCITTFSCVKEQKKKRNERFMAVGFVG